MGMVLICVGLEYENYGGKYHCWLQMDTKYVYFKVTYVYYSNVLRAYKLLRPDTVHRVHLENGKKL